MEQPAWMAFAWAELGQREIAGSGDNARIMAMFRELGHIEASHDEVPWCAAFVGASLQRAGVAGSGSLLARSYLDWGDGMAQGRLGAVAIFSRGSDAVSGHVGFYLDADRSSVYVLGGNQGDAVSVSAIDRDQLLGLRWPSDGTQQRPVAAAPSISPEFFDTALRHVLAMEGGWTEDPYDPGGPTNFGITLTTLAAYRGATVDASTFGALRQLLKRISASEVRDIYLQRYWRPSRSDQLSPALALMHFDAAVNHGVDAAARMLQEAVGTEIDGEIGPLTLRACVATPIDEALPRYAEIRRARYRALGHFWRFGKGWLARVDATFAAASNLKDVSPRNTEGDNSMTSANDNSTETAAPAAKWWGQSLTVWGTIITAASTVLPVLGPLIGLDISAELIRQLGSQSVQLAQAIGGIAGTIMTLYGRVRASAPLTRRALTMQV